MNNKYDAVIIGSGCGGAATAALMSYLGLKTLLLEKNSSLGGRASTYEKDGFKLDHGHIIMRCEKGPHGEVLRIVNRKDLIPRFSHCTGWATKAVVADVTMDFSPSFWKLLLNLGIFKQLSAYRLTLREIAQLGRFALKVRFMTSRKIAELDGIDMKTYLSRFTTNNYFHTFIGGLATVGFGALNEESSAGEMVRVIQAGLKDRANMGYPVTGEGVSAIPKSFINAAQTFGCHLKTNASVEGILVEGGVAKGVRVNGDTISATHVISNAGVQETVSKLVGTEHFDNNYVQKIKNLKYSYGGMSLKYAVDRKITNYCWGGEIPDNLEQITGNMMEGVIPEKFPVMFVCPSNIDSSLAPDNKQVLSFISGGPAVAPGKVDWTRWVEKMKVQVEAFFPGLKENTRYCEVSTPDDIARYTGRLFGDAVGVSQTVDQVGGLRPSPISPIQGLYYTGSDVGCGNFATELASQSAIALYHHIKAGGGL
ncbi:MAG: NAD(P)/FAD-dependent oxidoreductase [Desulfobacterales bacterium]|nr:NAD(P)/FAD-dependent oxidoreductase [Desulfobacterales bacterium]